MEDSKIVKLVCSLFFMLNRTNHMTKHNNFFSGYCSFKQSNEHVPYYIKDPTNTNAGRTLSPIFVKFGYVVNSRNKSTLYFAEKF